MRRVLICAVLAALTAGCGGSDMLDGTVWSAASVDGRAVDNADVTAIFEDGRMGGRSGCNHYGAGYETSGAAFSFTEPIMSTLMACEEPVMDLERRYLRALESVSEFALDDSTLTLLGDGRTLVTFTEISQELASTSWEITSYADGDGLVFTIVGTRTSVSFDSEALTATAGCNTMSGTYGTDGDEIAVRDLMTTDMFCTQPDGVMEQEAAVAQALGAARRYRVEGQTLTIWDEEGRVVLSLSRP